MPKGRRYTSQDRKTGFQFGGGKIWESKDGRYLYRYIYSNIHGKKSRSLMRANMPAWKGVSRGR